MSVPGDHVVEIGAGLGSLTVALAATRAEVTAVEVDRGIVPVLREMVEPLGVTVVEADAMSCDWARLLGGGAPVGARRQPALQRRHPPRPRSAP